MLFAILINLHIELLMIQNLRFWGLDILFYTNLE